MNRWIARAAVATAATAAALLPSVAAAAPAPAGCIQGADLCAPLVEVDATVDAVIVVDRELSPDGNEWRGCRDGILCVLDNKDW